MPSPRKPRAAKTLLRPAADSTCRKTRTVTRGRVQLDVWSCSAPTPGAPLDDPPCVRWVPEVVKVGRRNWMLWYASRAECEGDDALVSEPGWYFNAARPNPEWINNAPVGPYCSSDEALDDLVLGQASGY
jgi:hypothetical protein